MRPKRKRVLGRGGGGSTGCMTWKAVRHPDPRDLWRVQVIWEPESAGLSKKGTWYDEGFAAKTEGRRRRRKKMWGWRAA